MRKSFAVDIDNVLAEAESEVQRLYQELKGEPWPRGTYGSAGGLDSSPLDREFIEEIFSRFHEESIPRLPLLPCVKPAMELLRREYRIIIVTARRPHSRPQTLGWLDKHRLPYDALYHTEDKAEIPEILSGAIDDHPVHVQKYSEMGIPVFVMDRPWNRMVENPKITRVTGWDSLIQWLHSRPKTSWSQKVPESPKPHTLLTAHKRSGRISNIS